MDATILLLLLMVKTTYPEKLTPLSSGPFGRAFRTPSTLDKRNPEIDLFALYTSNFTHRDQHWNPYIAPISSLIHNPVPDSGETPFLHRGGYRPLGAGIPLTQEPHRTISSLPEHDHFITGDHITNAHFRHEPKASFTDFSQSKTPALVNVLSSNAPSHSSKISSSDNTSYDYSPPKDPIAFSALVNSSKSISPDIIVDESPFPPDPFVYASPVSSSEETSDIVGYEYKVPKDPLTFPPSLNIPKSVTDTSGYRYTTPANSTSYKLPITISTTPGISGYEYPTPFNPFSLSSQAETFKAMPSDILGYEYLTPENLHTELFPATTLEVPYGNVGYEYLNPLNPLSYGDPTKQLESKSSDHTEQELPNHINPPSYVPPKTKENSSPVHKHLVQESLVTKSNLIHKPTVAPGYTANGYIISQDLLSNNFPIYVFNTPPSEEYEAPRSPVGNKKLPVSENPHTSTSSRPNNLSKVPSSNSSAYEYSLPFNPYKYKHIPPTHSSKAPSSDQDGYDYLVPANPLIFVPSTTPKTQTINHTDDTNSSPNSLVYLPPDSELKPPNVLYEAPASALPHKLQPVLVRNNNSPPAEVLHPLQIYVTPKSAYKLPLTKPPSVTNLPHSLYETPTPGPLSRPTSIKMRPNNFESLPTYFELPDSIPYPSIPDLNPLYQSPPLTQSYGHPSADGAHESTSTKQEGKPLYEDEHDDKSLDFSHNFNFDGEMASGIYQILLSNGQTQTVEYTIDPHKGYQVEVRSEEGRESSIKNPIKSDHSERGPISKYQIPPPLYLAPAHT